MKTSKGLKNEFIIGGVAILIFMGGLWWSKSLETTQLEAEDTGGDASQIISQSGLHWHTQLSIYVNGERQNIPTNIGVGTAYASKPTFDAGMRMTAIHTHEPDGTIHLEFPGQVREEDTVLGNFFRIWGKDFMEFGPIVAMMVNSKENTELEKYEMKDGDKIELRYERR